MDERQGGAAPDWYADPTGRHQHRYWDGASWTRDVADAGVASSDELVAAPAAEDASDEGDGPEHAIVTLVNESSGGSNRYILTDIERSELKDGMLGSPLAWNLDIQSEDQVEELFSQGRTATTSIVGQPQAVTLEWCACDDPASHRRSGS